MKIKNLSPKARKAFGQSQIDAGMAIFKAFLLLVTVLPVSFILKSLADNKDTEVTLVSSIEKMSPGVYFMLMGFIFLSLASGWLLRKNGLKHIHEAEQQEALNKR